MKRQFLLTRMLLLFALIVGSGSNAWADESWSYTFVSPNAISSNSITVNEATWTVSTTSGKGSPTISAEKSHSKYGLKFGSNSTTYFGTVTFSTDYFKNYNVTSVTVNILNNGSKAGTLSAQQNSKSIGSKTQTFGQEWTDLTVNTNVGSGGSLSFTYSVEQAFYINSITVTYTVPTGDPSIIVSPSSRTVIYDAEYGTLNVTLDKIDTELGTDIAYYESDGTTPTTYSWFTASINGDGNVEYLLDTNTDPDNNRTAYFKVYGYNEDDDSEIVYSDLVAITQNKYTVDFATLPFEYDGGKGDLPTGMTHIGLGSDYTSSPLLKFDHTDDNLILKVKGSLPKQLSFDIEGKTFSGGTFKVQWSANGTDYTDLKTYSSSITNGNEKIDLTSCTGLKYIKWIYTLKSSGNVALGNINVTPQTTSVTISSAKYATLCSDKALDFSGTDITAYTATDGATKVTLNEITSGKVPANTPVVLHNADADGTPVDVPVIASADAVGDNDLAVVTDEEGKVGVENMFVLSKPAEKNVGFYAWKVGSTLNKGKVYLQGKASYESRSFLGFDDETTGIEAVDVNTESANVAREYYNLNGQRVANPSKGLYIVNGKKVIIK